MKVRGVGIRLEVIVTATCMVFLLGAVLALPPVAAVLSKRVDRLTGSSAPSSSSPLALSGGRLVVANPDSNSISIVNLADYAVAEIEVGLEPRSVLLDPAGDRVFVANRRSHSLSVVDLAAGREVRSVGTGYQPVSLAAPPDFAFLVIAESGDDRLRFIDPQTLRTLSLLAVDDRPYGLAFSGDGQYLLVTHLLSGQVTIVRARPFAAYLPAITGSTGAYEARGTPAPVELATWPNVAPAPAVVINRANTRAYLPQTMANGLGLNTQFDTTVFPKVSVLNLQQWRHETAEHISLPETDQPVGLPWAAALAASGQELWIANAASNDVSIVDISKPAFPKRRGHILVGANPRGILLDEPHRRAYVSNALDGTVSVIDMDALAVVETVPVTEIPLPPLLLRGKRLFYSSEHPQLARARWISCNSCHIEGEQDGRTWQLLTMDPTGGEGGQSARQQTIPRNTTSLLGMVETYPLRWSAEWDESADSEFSIRFEQFGEGLIAGEMHPTLGQPNQGRSADLDALAAYIDSLPLPARVRPLNDAEKRGKVIFESAESGCLPCHPPPLYTDRQQHDVGTADGPQERLGPAIDTPSLRALYDSPPYLHDGSAADLTAVLTEKNSEGKHGKTSHLTSGELNDLEAYLLGLTGGP